MAPFNQKSQNNEAMVGETLNFLKNSPAALAAKPALSTKNDLLQDTWVTYQDNKGRYVTLYFEKIGKTKDVAEAKKDYVKGIMGIIEPAKSWARTTKNNEVLAAVNFTFGKLVNKSFTELDYITVSVKAAATVHLVELADYGGTADRITIIDTKKAAYLDIRQDRDLTKDQMRAAKISADDGLNEIMRILREEVDPLVRDMEDDFKEFHDGYFSARVIVDLPATHDTTPPEEPPTEEPPAEPTSDASPEPPTDSTEPTEPPPDPVEPPPAG